MTSTASQNSPAQSRGRIISIWVLRALLAALFLATAAMKLTSQPMAVAEFDKVGFGQWFRFFTGALELIGAIAVLTPRFSTAGALVLLLVDVGAFVAQISILHMDWIHPIVIGALLATLIVLQRDKAGRLGRGF